MLLVQCTEATHEREFLEALRAVFVMDSHSCRCEPASSAMTTNLHATGW